MTDPRRSPVADPALSSKAAAMANYIEGSRLTFARALKLKSSSEYGRQRDKALAQLAQGVAEGARAAGFYAIAVDDGYVFHRSELGAAQRYGDGHRIDGAVLLLVGSADGNLHIDDGTRGHLETILLTYDAGTNEVFAPPLEGDNLLRDAGEVVAKSIVAALQRRYDSH